MPVAESALPTSIPVPDLIREKSCGIDILTGRSVQRPNHLSSRILRQSSPLHGARYHLVSQLLGRRSDQIVCFQAELFKDLPDRLNSQVSFLLRQFCGPQSIPDVLVFSECVPDTNTT